MLLFATCLIFIYTALRSAYIRAKCFWLKNWGATLGKDERWNGGAVPKCLYPEPAWKSERESLHSTTVRSEYIERERRELCLDAPERSSYVQSRENARIRKERKFSARVEWIRTESESTSRIDTHARFQCFRLALLNWLTKLSSYYRRSKYYLLSVG